MKTRPKRTELCIPSVGAVGSAVVRAVVTVGATALVTVVVTAVVTVVVTASVTAVRVWNRFVSNQQSVSTRMSIKIPMVDSTPYEVLYNIPALLLVVRTLAMVPKVFDVCVGAVFRY